MAVNDMGVRREFMVLNQIAARGITDERVLSAMRELPRERFISSECLPYAYDDCPLPIGFGQTISQPFIVAYMLEALGLRGGERVLEIGAGSGYQAALLGMLARRVWSVERIAELKERASGLIEELGMRNVAILLGDGFVGLPDEAPFRAIVISAAPVGIPPALLEQLSPAGGVLIGPEGRLGDQSLVRIRREGSRFDREVLLDVAFVPMLPGTA
jgi:protein-L-isoaspartate(D-aspartate) O-methyltransferase